MSPHRSYVGAPDHTPAERLALVKRILAVAPDYAHLFGLARLAGTRPHEWMDSTVKPWVGAEELVHRAETNQIAPLYETLDALEMRPIPTPNPERPPTEVRGVPDAPIGGDDR